MESKTSFILYVDQRNMIEMLSDEKAGQLLKHIFAYVNDEDPQTDDPIIQLAFEPIKQQFKRDLIKWLNTKEARSKAGKASAEARRINKDNSTNSTYVNYVQQTSTNSTVNDNVNVNDNVSVNVNDNNIYIPTFEDFLNYAIEHKPKVSKIDLKYKYESWLQNDWKDGNDKKIKNWKTKLLNTLSYIKEDTTFAQPRISV